MSLPVYVLVLLAFRRPESAEAALKYLVLGGTASATLLMGVSLLYGATGSLALSVFADAIDSPSAMASIGVALIVVAFFLKAAIVPFHTWAPDAYEAAAVPVTAYMATIIKAGVLLAAVRLFGGATLSPPIADLLAILPLLSIVWGNLAAMRQRSLRRMIAYSSIAHAGYLFYAFLGDGPGRFQAVAFYVLVYGLMNVLAFAALPPDSDDAARDRLDNLKGLFHRDPFAALMIGVAMLSLAGIPPFPGFIAKFLIFKNVIAAGLTLYAVLGLDRQLPGHLLLSARDPVPLHEHRRSEPSSRGRPGAWRSAQALSVLWRRSCWRCFRVGRSACRRRYALEARGRAGSVARRSIRVVKPAEARGVLSGGTALSPDPRVHRVIRRIHGVPITRNTAKKKSVISNPSR